jgi:hypothetical protein
MSREREHSLISYSWENSVFSEWLAGKLASVAHSAKRWWARVSMRGAMRLARATSTRRDFCDDETSLGFVGHHSALIMENLQIDESKRFIWRYCGWLAEHHHVFVREGQRDEAEARSLLIR